MHRSPRARAGRRLAPCGPPGWSGSWARSCAAGRRRSWSSGAGSGAARGG